jgi:type I restriction enzyme S subunit
MNNILKLLENCAVEWKTLGEVAEIGTGRSNKEDENESGLYPFYVRSKNILKSNTFQFDEVAIIIPGEGGIGDIFHYVNGKYALHQRAYRINISSEDLNTKFLYYFMMQAFKSYILMKSVGATSLSIRKPMLQAFPIPIPPLAVQAEIVRILDTFTAYTAELTAELTARKKQYAYYRDQLLSEAELAKVGFEWKTLGEVCEIFLGLTYTPTYVSEGVKFISAQNTSSDFLDLSNVKYISNDEYLKSTSNAKPKRGDLLFTRVGSNLGHPVIVDTDEPLCIFVSLGFIRVNSIYLLNKYVKYWMTTDLFWEQVRKNVHGSAKVNLNTGWLKKFQIPIPPLAEQARIVGILDQFDALTHSLTEGLPREIELRQKQYEHYREQLLSFKNSPPAEGWQA